MAAASLRFPSEPADILGWFRNLRKSAGGSRASAPPFPPAAMKVRDKSAIGFGRKPCLKRLHH
jgi:hypothetical protein